MTIRYRTDNPPDWTQWADADLPAEYIDENFFTLAQLYQSIVDNPPEAISIDSFEVIGNQLYIHMSDYSTQGPFDMPQVTYSPQGVWQPATLYHVNDLVSFGGVLYVVIFEHTSDATAFDPNDNDGAGHDYYRVFFEAPETAFPAGGNERQVLGKLSDADGDFGWISGLLPLGGTTGQVLKKQSDTDLDADWEDEATATGIPIKTVSASDYTLTATTISVDGDEGTYIRMTSTSGGTVVRVPLNSAQPFAIGAEVTVRHAAVVSVGLIFTPAVGVTLNIPAGFTARLFGSHATGVVKKVGTNAWDLFGLLAAS